MNPFLTQLCDWLKADLFCRKVLFVRNRAAGRQLLRMAAGHDAPAVNTEPVTVREYMNSLADPVLDRMGLKRIDSLTATIALREIMRGEGDAFTTMGEVELATAGSVLPQLEELERNGVTPERLEGTGEELLSHVWRRFLAWKEENGYASERQILEAAVLPPDVSFAILSHVEADETERAFLDGIPEGRLRVISLQMPEGGDSLRNAYAPGLTGAGAGGEALFQSVECFDCQDIGMEIRFAYQYMVEHGIPAEETVMVCPDEAYGLRTAEEGRLLGFGVDSLFGVPAPMTRGAQLIRCLLDWQGRNYDAEALTPALTSGSMRLGGEEGTVSGERMLSRVRRERVGWGRERWEQLAGADNALDREIGRAMSAWVRFFEAPPRGAREVAGDLAGLLRECMAQGDDHAFYLNLVDGLSRIYTGLMRGGEYLSRVEEAATGQRVGRMAEQPGHVYCCGYENALYLDRRCFILLGMNWDAFNALGSDFPLLHDDRKAALSPRLALSGDRARTKRYEVRELLLNRKDARAVFLRAGMNHAGGDDLIPAGLFEEAARHTGGAKPVTILGRSPMTLLDVYLRGGFEVETTAEGGAGDREEMWKQAFEGRVWSATVLETALSCPRRFTLGTQLGLGAENPEALEQFGPAWLSARDRGELVHRVLEAYFRSVAPRTDTPDTGLLGRLLDYQLEAFRREVPVPSNLTDLSEEIGAIRDMVEEAARMHARDEGRETVAAEADFGRKEPVVLTFGRHRLRLTGRIDRVDRTPGGMEIIDYKTGRPSGFRRSMPGRLQYYLYTLAWEQLHPEERVCAARYYLLDGAGGIEQVVLPMDGEERAAMEQKMTELLDLLSDPAGAMTPGFARDGDEEGYDACPAYCPFRDLCPAIFG